MDMYVETPSGNEAEKHYGEVRPSLLLAMPGAILSVLVGLVASHLLPPIIMASPLGSVASPFLVWLGVWIICLVPSGWKILVLATTQYEITSQRIFYRRGVLNRDQDQLELMRIRDLGIHKPFFQRIVGLGSLRLETVDRTHPTLIIPGQHNVDELKQFLHQLNVAERARLGYREFESTLQ